MAAGYSPSTPLADTDGVIYLYAIGSAFFYGLASVLQQHSASGEPSKDSMRLELLWLLIRQPIWLGGLGADVAAFLLQALALSRGPLTLVQPVLTVGLLFALILSSLWARRMLPAKEIVAALALVAGLAILVVVGSPTAGRDTAAARSWLIVGLTLAVIIATLFLLAKRADKRVKPVLLAVAGAMALAAGDSLIKSTVAAFNHAGLLGVVEGWYPYALAVVLVLGMVLVQSAFQAGPLELSLPAQTAVEPLVGSVAGIVLFSERIRLNLIAGLGEAVAIGLILAGIWVLGRSPTVVGGQNKATALRRERQAGRPSVTVDG